MIVVDSSAIIAILGKEQDASVYAKAIFYAERLLISSVNVHECGIVLRLRRGIPAVQRLWRFIKEDNDFEICSFDEAQVQAALRAFDSYGKGIHPDARLNLSDCAAYALAKTMNVPLLFKGLDFVHTDIVPALTPQYP